MIPCICGTSFHPNVPAYRRHVKADAHHAWRVSEGIELDGVAPSYPCRCGVIHMVDTRVGREHFEARAA